jgi:hypothetical protein
MKPESWICDKCGEMKPPAGETFTGDACSCDRLKRERERAINILDGNEEPVDWRDRANPELLRKLCEHLEYFSELQQMESKLDDLMEKLRKVKLIAMGELITSERCRMIYEFLDDVNIFNKEKENELKKDERPVARGNAVANCRRTQE